MAYQFSITAYALTPTPATSGFFPFVQKRVTSFAWDFLAFTLKVPHPRTHLVPGKPGWLVIGRYADE